MNPNKTAVLQACLDLVAEKTQELTISIRDANEAANEDTKSSAGDKFETTREMMNQEIDKATAQLTVLREMSQQLEKIRPGIAMQAIGFGSLVETSEGLYFFSVSLGKLNVDNQQVYALSMASPLGQAMTGARKSDTIRFRDRTIQVIDLA